MCHGAFLGRLPLGLFPLVGNTNYGTWRTRGRPAFKCDPERYSQMTKIILEVDTQDPVAVADVIVVLEGFMNADAVPVKAAKPVAKKAAAKKATTKKTEPEPESESTGPTRDEVRTKLKEFSVLEGKEAAIQILKDHGAASIGELDEEHFVAVMAKCDE